MSKVLIHGATGTVGGALAHQLLRSGNHIVYGTARTPEKARGLAAEEIISILCPDPVNQGQAWHDAVRKYRIDVVVDATTAADGSLKILDAVRALGKERLDIAQQEGIAPPQKLGFLYTSGVWVHGSSLEKVSDLTPVGVSSSPAPPMELVKARPGLEQAVLKPRDVLDVAIVRPSGVYGRSSWIFDSLFKPIFEAKGAASVQVPVTEEAMPCYIHADDVATGMQAVLEKLPLLGGSGAHPIFDLSTSNENLALIVKVAARLLGYEGTVELVGPGDNLFFKALNLCQNIDSSRARQLLGWEPKKIGFLANIDVYITAWKAHQEQSAKL